MWTRLWQDETAAVLSTELIVVTTIVVIGAATGLSTLRDAIVTEMADVAAAVGTMDQSYRVPGLSSNGAATASTSYVDARDVDELSTGAAFSNPRCIVVCSAALPTLLGSEAGL